MKYLFLSLLFIANTASAKHKVSCTDLIIDSGVDGVTVIETPEVKNGAFDKTSIKFVKEYNDQSEKLYLVISIVSEDAYYEEKGFRVKFKGGEKLYFPETPIKCANVGDGIFILSVKQELSADLIEKIGNNSITSVKLYFFNTNVVNNHSEKLSKYFECLLNTTNS